MAGMLPGETYPQYVRRLYEEERYAKQAAEQEKQRRIGMNMQLTNQRNENAINVMRNDISLSEMRNRGMQPIGSITQAHKRALGGY